MATAGFKDLCIDATNGHAAGRFWADLLGLELHLQDHGDSYLLGPTPEHTIWVNQVPETKTVKQRVHLDVSAPIDAASTGGAQIRDVHGDFATMDDPEGGEFCLQARDLPPGRRIDAVVIDCADHRSQARWWADTIGGLVHHEGDRYSALTAIPGAPFDRLTFMPVPEAKSVKNRLHLDLFAPHLDPIVEHGATVLRRRDDEIEWDVLADPEGNEFCIFEPR